MKRRPPRSGGPGRGFGKSGAGKSGPGTSGAGKGKPRPGAGHQRAGTGPRTTALDAARRAGRQPSADAGDRNPWEAANEGAPAKPRQPRADNPVEAAARPVARTVPEARSRTAPPAGPTRREQRAAASATLSTGVQTLSVAPDEAGMRIDRFLTARFPQLPFTRIQSLVRKGELRVDGRRVRTADRLEPGQQVRVPPLKLDQPSERPRNAAREADDATFLRSLILYEDADMMILNKPFGLAVQGGSGTVRHVDGLLDALTGKDGQRPRLVHRLDKDTAGCLIVAKTRLAAATLAKSFRSRAARKIYWALAAGVPRTRQGRVSTYLAKEQAQETHERADARMRVARHGDEGASHALTYYAVVDQAAQKLAWLSLKPVTGRTHQLRAHAAHIGHPIVGDPKYFDVENWELPGGIQNRLHLLARRIVIPHPRNGEPVDVSAPLPPHMAQSWNLLGFETADYDPIVEAPED